jgi:hypothetical protein
MNIKYKRKRNIKYKSNHIMEAHYIIPHLKYEHWSYSRSKRCVVHILLWSVMMYADFA